MIFNFSYLLIYIVVGIVLAIIWGFNSKDLAIFVSSILAVLGVGFFASWSILSNITASVILFFNHPIRIGDRIRILDKDFNLTGEIKDITSFFLFLKTDEGENISLPTSLIMQKGIEILGEKSSEIIPVTKKEDSQ